MITQKFNLQALQNYGSILQISLLWIVVPSHICSIILCHLIIMGQQPQVIVHINQAFCLVYIQVVSLHVVDEAIGFSTPLCRRSVNL